MIHYTQPLSPGCVHPKISSSVSLFVLWLVRSGLFFIMLLFFFSNYQFLILASLTSATPALSTLWFFETFRNLKHLQRTKKKNVIQELKFFFKKGRNHYWERRKCWPLAFPPFPTMFSENFFFDSNFFIKWLIGQCRSKSENYIQCNPISILSVHIWRATKE